MPEEEKKRIRPVIEEVVDEAEPKGEEPRHEHSRAHQHQPPPAPLDTASEIPSKKTNLKLVVAIVAITASLVGALAGGLYVYFSGLQGLGTKKAVPTPTPTLPSATAVPSPTPTASPAAEIKLASYKVSILNGSGKIGEATRAKALLEKEGFKVSYVGNAKTFDFEETVIQTKENVPASVVDTIKDALAKNYTLEIGNPLKSSESYDIIITVGSK